MSNPKPLSDLTSCDREPIHIPGSVQPRGMLIALKAGGTAITHASRNAAALLKRPAATILGTRLVELTGIDAARQIVDALARGGKNPAIPARLFGLKLDGIDQLFNVSTHLFDGRMIVEFEPALGDEQQAPLDMVRVIMTELQQTRTLHDLCDATVEQLRKLIGFDRVMIYRFLQDQSGQVIAESRSSNFEPLLNLRYPASDIPRQARELYKKNWVRLIDDAHTDPVDVLVVPEEAGSPLDMSFADLRSVSPIHIEYLRNMGVAASMSISIIVGNELWGLIACHHHKPHAVPANVRAAAELIGQVFSLQIQTVEGIEAYVTMRAARALLDRVVAEFPVDGELIDNLTERLDQLSAFIPCDGSGIWMDGAWRTQGIAPAAAEVRELAEHLAHHHEHGIYATHNLAAEFDAAALWKSGIRGVLAVPLSHTSGNWLFFFRIEVTQAIEWAGDPNKAATPSGSSGRLSPRKSFQAWKVDVRGQSLPWTSRERLIGDTLRIYLLDIIVRFSDVIMEERRRAEQRHRLATSEINQRIKGTLELIQSLIVNGVSDHNRVDDFVRALDGRLKAIAQAHDTISTAAGGDVRGLIESAISMHLHGCTAIDLNGPDTKLNSKAYTALTLVIHELATNASNSGALSAEDGRLDVRWNIDARGQLILTWDEVLPSRNMAFSKPRDTLSMAIIKRNIPHTLGGEADIAIKHNVIHASFLIPARYIAEPAKPAVTYEPRIQLMPPGKPLQGYSVLIVDEDTAAAHALKKELVERGIGKCLLAAAAPDALEMMSHELPDVAIINIDGGEYSHIELADVLTHRSVPFIFAGEEADPKAIPDHYGEVPVAEKPYAAEAVAALLNEALLPNLIRAVLGRLV